MYPRPVEPFELFEEDFLASRPVPSEFVEIEPPPWTMRCLLKMGGKRHPKRVKVATTGGYQVSGAVVPWRPPGGPSGPQRNPDAEDAYRRAMERRHRKQAAKGLSAAQLEDNGAPVPMGNLRSDDYRFWKGFALASEADKNQGTCRWCAVLCVGRDSMRQHHVNNYCKEYLLALYKYAFKSSKQRYCFACKRETTERKWGVIMCNRKTCIARWKFNFNHALLGFQQYRLWATNAQILHPSDGPFTGLPDPDDEESITGTPC